MILYPSHALPSFLAGAPIRPMSPTCAFDTGRAGYVFGSCGYIRAQHMPLVKCMQTHRVHAPHCVINKHQFTDGCGCDDDLSVAQLSNIHLRSLPLTCAWPHELGQPVKWIRTGRGMSSDASSFSIRVTALCVGAGSRYNTHICEVSDWCTLSVAQNRSLTCSVQALVTEVALQCHERGHDQHRHDVLACCNSGDFSAVGDWECKGNHRRMRLVIRGAPRTCSLSLTGQTRRTGSRCRTPWHV
jgi:hypothetical protein